MGKEGIHLAVHSLREFKYCMPEIILFELRWPLIWRTHWPCCSRELSFEISYSFWSSDEMGKSGDLTLMSSFIQQRKMKSKWVKFKGKYGGIKVIFMSDQIMCLCIYPYVPYPKPNEHIKICRVEYNCFVQEAEVFGVLFLYLVLTINMLSISWRIQTHAEPTYK